MHELEAKVSAEQAVLLGKSPAPSRRSRGRRALKSRSTISSKVDLRVGQVLSAERVKGADKLLHLKVDHRRSRAAHHRGRHRRSLRSRKQLVGRKVVIVANLQPRKLRGLTSNGMIVAASLEGGKPVLAGFLEDIPVGARLK